MNQKKKVIILIAVLILLLAGTSILYSVLSKRNKAGNLSTAKTTSAQERTKEDNQTTEETKSASGSEQDSKGNQQKVPDFKTFDREGNEVNLSDFYGKPVILNFWASWCGPCKVEMPHFEDAYKKYGEEIHFLMVNMTDGSQETVEKASDFIQKKGYTFPVYYDKELEAATKYSVFSIPTTYFIDSEGMAVANAQGSLDQSTLQKGIDMLLKK